MSGIGASVGKLGTLAATGLAAGAAAGVAAAGALGAAWLSVSSEIDQSQRDLQAQLGVSADASKRLGAVGQEVFKGNWGESIGEATQAVGLFAKAFNFNLSTDEMKNMAEQAFAVQEAFEFDVSSQATALGILSASFDDVASDGTKALDQITSVMQMSGGNADDLLETIGEYSPLFKQLGFDSEQFFGVLQSGLQAGARDTDYVADAIKEFGIRITDNSKSTNEALSNLGLDGLGEQVRTGMTTGADAFQMIQDKLAELPPDMRAAEGAVALFGTKFEDLGPEIFAALSTDPLTNFEGAAMDAGNAASASIGGALEGLKRTAMLALAGIGGGEAFGAFKDRAIEAINAVSASIGPAMEILKAAFSGDWTDAALQASAKLREMFGADIGTGITHLVSMFGEMGMAMKDLAAGNLDAFFNSIEAAVYRVLAAFEKLTGIDMTALITFMAGDDDGGPGAIDALSDAIITLSGWVTTIVEKLGGWSTVIGVVATALAAFGIITTVVGWVSGLMAAWASLGAGITAAGGIIGAIIAVLGGPLTIAIAAVAAIVAGLALAWKNDWGGMRDKVAEIVGWIQANVVPAITAAFGQVQAVLGNLVAWWQANGAEVIAVVSGIVSFIVKQFEFLFNIIGGIVKAGIALFTGDWRGLGEAVGSIIGNMIAAWVSMFKGIIAAVTAIFRGLWPAVKSALSAGVAGVISWLKGEGDKMADMTLQGLINGIKAGAGRVLAALKDLAGGLVSGFMDAIDAHSPSKVFEQIGQWITMGLASGIQKADYKAVEALAKIITQMGAVANGLADFGKKIADMIVPSDQQIAAAKEKYLRMTMILTDFIKSISTLGSLLPVASMGQASPGQIRAINVELSQLSQGFPAIQELQGMTADDLLTGGEADWAARLADAVGKIAGVWGGIADSMTKIATAKFPSDDQLKAIKESTLRIATWATGALDTETLPSAGAEEFAKSIKAIVDALATVAGLDLADITRVVQEQLDIAKSNIELIGKWGYQIVTDWLKVAGDDKARAAWIVSLKDFADTTAAAANILKAGDVGNLADIAAVTQGQLDVARANIGAAGRFAWELVTAWAKNAGDATTRAAWIADLKDFADTIGAAVSIFKAGADASGKLGELTTIAEGAFDIIKQNLIDIGSNVASMAEWTFGFTDTFKAWADDMKTAVDVFRAGVDASGALGELTSIGGDALEIVKQNVIDIASTISGLAEWSFTWPEDFKTWADNVKTALDIFKGGADASKTLADVAAIPQHQLEIVRLNLIEIAGAMSDTSAWEFPFSDTFGVWANNIKTALDIFKAGADASKTLADVSAIAGHQFDIIKLNVIEIAGAMSDLSQWEFTFPDTFDVWGKNVTTAVGIFATVAKSIADIGATQVSDIAGKLAPMKAAIVAMLKMIGEIAADIGVEEAKARAELAEAIGRAGGALGDFGGGIGGIMELVQSKLFGSDASRGGLGFTQRTKTNRADFFATQLTDTVKRAVGAVQDALSGISIQPNDPKVAALGQLGEAFGKLADGLTKLAEAKLPDAGQLAAIMAATGGASLALAGAAGGGGGAGPTVTGMGGGDMYIQYGNNVIVTDADDQQGLIEALKASIR